MSQKSPGTNEKRIFVGDIKTMRKFYKEVGREEMRKSYRAKRTKGEHNSANLVSKKSIDNK